MEHFQAAVKALALGDPILRVLAISRQLGYAFYLINDALVWVRNGPLTASKRGDIPLGAPAQLWRRDQLTTSILPCPACNTYTLSRFPPPNWNLSFTQAHSAKIKVYAKDRYAQISTNAARFWAIGIFSSILSGLYKLRDVQVRQARIQRAGTLSTPEKEADRKVEIKALKT